LFNTEDPWRDLGLIYKVQWPLSVVLTTAVVDRYQMIFKYLFPIKHVQVDLLNVWTNFNQKNRMHNAETKFR